MRTYQKDHLHVRQTRRPSCRRPHARHRCNHPQCVRMERRKVLASRYIRQGLKTSPEIIRLAVMLYVRFPLSLRNVEDLLHERGIEISHETARFWWNRFGPMFAAEIRRNRVNRMRSYSNWQWHLDEVFVKINGETHYQGAIQVGCGVRLAVYGCGSANSTHQTISSSIEPLL